MPSTPSIDEGETVSAKTGQTKTWNELITASDVNIKPADLIREAKFSKVSILKATYATTDAEPKYEAEETIAEDATGYTFLYDGVYTFSFSVTNKKGTATSQIVVNTVDAVRAVAKVDVNFAATEKILSWEALDGATGYRVAYGTTVEDITATSYAFTDAADGEYAVKIFPIYGTAIYPTSETEARVYVGAVTTPLLLKRDPYSYKISWQERPFALSYEVTEGGRAAVTLPATQLEYALQGSYQNNEIISVKVVAKFESKQTEDSCIEIAYGVLTVTMKGMNLTKASEGGIAETTGIESVVVGENFPGASFVMVEFTGKNAPNYAFRAEEQVTEIKHGVSNAYWSKAGIFYWNSYVDITGKGSTAGVIYLSRGFGSGTNCVPDVRHPSGTVNSPGAGLKRYTDGVKYIQIVGYEQYEGSTTSILQTVYTFEVQDDGTLVTVCASVQEGKNSWHAISATGVKTIIYPHTNTPTLKTDDITFTYYPAAQSLASLVNDTHSPYKTQLKTLLNV